MPIEEITREGVVLPVHVDPTGVNGPTPKAVRSKRWRRVGRGWYVAADVDPGHVDQRIVEAMAGLPDRAAITGWAALAWQRARWFSGLAPDGCTPLPVPVALGDKHLTEQRADRQISEDWLFDDDVVVIDGLRITVPNRSVTFETRRARWLDQAIRVIDMAAYDDLIDLDDLSDYVQRLVARQGIRLTRKALPLARENAWSPQEVRMRTRWTAAVDAPGLLCNPPVFDLGGAHLFTPDLFDPAVGVAGEYDGAVHEKLTVRRRDLNREEVYRAHGIEVVTMMSASRSDARSFDARLVAAYARARDRPVSTYWTLEQPDWWVDTSTVARRRALTPDQRAVWLRRRSSADRPT